jgi:uncharacterized HAD superfamily protein
MIYVDFDDCVCETCQSLTAFARERFGRAVEVADMTDYDLRVSFSFDEETYRRFMTAFHETQLASIPETPGAVGVLRRWLAEGRDPVIVTGRPTYSREPTLAWLAARGLGAMRVLHVDKYATLFNASPDPLITPFPALKSMGFDFAVEDAPNAVRMIAETALCPCAVFSRPWNARFPLPSGPFRRAETWAEIEESSESQEASGECRIQ